ncbi:V-set and transmembrane domain-containing protein 2-like protein [Astyanax mexicanus]|uniref:V-set and transmembrane domain-containing protein 2-like protein n=1 Tax=Astyanax mexicanus TaxID=7994 RepID=A0A3B1JV72_ASTMX|nr:V-set and transmembrane domain-containing protein 2-like protein [Astyanax mexicanus]
MGPFGALLWISHYVGLFLQLSAASQASGDAEVDNHLSGNALFTEVPHDIITQSGRDVEMACSFRGAGSSSVSLEIQWWYLRQHREWTEKPAWTTNQVAPVEEMTRDATKISVVKVAGSNISHRLRLSSVKPTDEGTYECRVIDFSDSHAQHHRVRAYLQVQPTGPNVQLHNEDQQLHSDGQLQSEEQNLLQGSHPLQKGHSQITDREMQKKADQDLQHGDHKLHHQVHHKSHGSDSANKSEKMDSPPALHHDEHHRQDQDHQHHFHEGGHHQALEREGHQQMSKHTQASKKSQPKSHQSEVRAHKGHARENSNDCSTDDCVL